MITSAVKTKLRAGRVSLGGWLLLGSPSAAELMSRAGFDWLIIEGEHAAAGMNDVQLMLQAMNGSPTVPMLRVPWNDRVAVKVALDIGVKGIMFPMINSREEAQEAVRACKFPPDGVRGIGSGRASLYGMGGPDYLKSANDDLLIYIIIEHERAVAHIDEILSVPGIDGAFFGFADYAASIGLTGQTAHPRVIEARDQVLAATQRAGVAAGYAARSLNQAQELARMGFRLITLGSDAGFMLQGAREALAGMVLS
jgi:4-hydroxy-2-oxoheptanedioate aldolase